LGPRTALAPSWESLRRRSLANRLERLAAEADRGSSRETMLLADRGQVQEARPELRRLLERLRDRRPAGPRGLEQVRWMLSDTSSPIFSAGWRGSEAEPGALRRCARDALAALG
jgi:hypothetical protein